MMKCLKYLRRYKKHTTYSYIYTTLSLCNCENDYRYIDHTV